MENLRKLINEGYLWCEGDSDNILIRFNHTETTITLNAIEFKVTTICGDGMLLENYNNKKRLSDMLKEKIESDRDSLLEIVKHYGGELGDSNIRYIPNEENISGSLDIEISIEYKLAMMKEKDLTSIRANILNAITDSLYDDLDSHEVIQLKAVNNVVSVSEDPTEIDDDDEPVYVKDLSVGSSGGVMAVDDEEDED